jgi:hypothetical protein
MTLYTVLNETVFIDNNNYKYRRIYGRRYMDGTLQSYYIQFIPIENDRPSDE